VLPPRSDLALQPVGEVDVQRACCEALEGGSQRSSVHGDARGWAQPVSYSCGTSVTAIYKFYLPWQKNTPKKVALTYGDHTQKPDLKNLLSHTEDALSEAGVWTDDNQVDEIPMRKWRCPRGEERVEILVTW
jgi:hypothetical protein